MFCGIFAALEEDQRVEEMRRALCDELPDDNYYILKYIINFLTEVSSWCVMLRKNIALCSQIMSS